MPSLARLFTLLAAAALPLQSAATIDRMIRFPSLHQGRFSQVEFAANKSHTPKGPTAEQCTSPSCYRYYNNKTLPYFIHSLPDVAWDIGEFYSGSVPIDASDPSRTLFFVFKPAMGGPVDEITIWLNGGPGCSSLVGFFQENGPILWQAGTAQPRRNPYTWANTTNMLWVEQPVGTGFAQGKVEATGEVDVGKEFVGFFKNWEKIFGIKNYKIYITGESYAGRYVPYISAAMLNQNDTTHFDLSGALMYDPCIGDCGYVQTVVPFVQFNINHNYIMNFNESAIAAQVEMASRCGWTDYLDKYLTFPPPHAQPPSKYNYDASCDPYEFEIAIYANNLCFNVYHITDYCPFLTDDVGRYKEPYFNRTDVKKAIHAPLDVDWSECGEHDVFVHGNDKGPWSINGPLPQVIDATKRVLISNADWDYLLPTNGTLLEIQNMTWGGKLGFQERPSTEFYVPLTPYPYYQGLGPQGGMGIQHYERGLMWVETYQAGHMQPQYQPRAALMHLYWLLGRIDSISSGP